VEFVAVFFGLAKQLPGLYQGGGALLCTGAGHGNSCRDIRAMDNLIRFPYPIQPSPICPCQLTSPAKAPVLSLNPRHRVAFTPFPGTQNCFGGICRNCRFLVYNRHRSGAWVHENVILQEWPQISQGGQSVKSAAVFCI